ncbi:cell surface protein [Opitutaceae bacterium TAV4]|nr:cell surface protein [Opitutaceae bacterium TAV4]RRK00410.1 cell surface protein [Opitutaceae bacterium TAV3]
MKRLTAILATVAACLLLAGCNLQITNLTPEAIPDNPSRIFTFSTRIDLKGVSVVPGSLVVRIVLDGQNFQMKPSELGQNIYEFDYQLPSGRDEIAYYYVANYKVQNAGGTAFAKEAYTDVIRSRIVGRYVLSLETNRGPVGARVTIVGRGFTPQDSVAFDGEPVRTAYDSANALAFYVPAVAAGRNYAVSVTGSSGTSPVGTFRVDPGSVQVTPSALSLTTGHSQSLTFTLPTPAPAGGLFLDVTTDIPQSVVMPEVNVSGGSTSATVTVQGGAPGTGSLFLKGYGAGEVVIPVTVR